DWRRNGAPQQREAGRARPQAGAGSRYKSWKQQAVRLPGRGQAGDKEARMSSAGNRFRTGTAPLKTIIAIDGPAGAGKSTIARHLARHFGLLNLETGAMYRAFALKALRAKVPLDKPAELERLAGETDIRLEPGDDENRVLLDDEDVTGLVRNPLVTDAAS